MSENLLTKADESGVYHLLTSRRSSIESAARHAHFCVLNADITKPASTEAVLRQLGAALNFPTWYGANFDALHDCLTDPDWAPAKGHLLLINGLAGLRSSNPEDFATLIDVLQSAAETRRATHAPFWVLIDAPARGIPTLAEA
jgi:RNAse (barnase) inhibitor barstar